MNTTMIPAAFFVVKPFDVALWVVALIIVGLLVMRKKSHRAKS